LLPRGVSIEAWANICPREMASLFRRQSRPGSVSFWVEPTLTGNGMSPNWMRNKLRALIPRSRQELVVFSGCLVLAALFSFILHPVKWSTMHEAFPITPKVIPYWGLTVAMSFIVGWIFPGRYWLWPEALFLGHASTSLLQLAHLGPLDWNVAV